MAALPPVKLRVHHFLCVHGFRGKGYSPAFVKNFWDTIERLRAGDARVEAVDGTDDICEPCPHNDSSLCNDDARIRRLDDAYAATLELRTGTVMRWEEAKQLVTEKVGDEEFERNCEPCGWKKLGYCRQALRDLRRDLRQALATAFVALAVGSLAASAADAAKGNGNGNGNGNGDGDGRYTTVETLEQKLLTDKARRIPALFKMQSALNKRDYRTALTVAKALESNVEFSDYYHFLAGQAELGRLRDAIRAGRWANAKLAGEQATFHFIQVQGTNPYTTLQRRATTLLGETEVTLGDIYLKTKKRVKAQQLFENGFQRLAQVNLLAVVPKSTIVSYALICEKQPSDLCTSWVVRLAPLVARTEEARILERVASRKRPVVEKSAQIPYRVDVDLQAFAKGFQYYLETKYEDAYATWRDLLKSYPRTTIRLRTKFWMGRAAQKSNHDVQAETLYREVIRELPFAYYALLASWFGNIDLSRMMDAELPLAATETPMLSPTELVHIRRAETLIASAVPELALLELQDVRPSLNMPNEFLVYLTVLNHLAGNHMAAFQVFGELSTRSFQGLFSSYGQKLVFPTTHLPLIRALSKSSKVDPLLLLSIIKQESAFNHEAISSANAYGLMQIITPTARDLDPKLDVGDLFEPTHNIRLGTKYVSQLLNRYKGNVIPALAAYNAGPGNADRWLREAPLNLPPEELIELIGFRETREYVQNILRNYYWYNRRVRGDALPSLPALTQTSELRNIQ